MFHSLKLDDFLITLNALISHKNMNIQQVATAETRDEIQNVIAHLQTAQTGDEILMILEALGGDTATPTLDPIEF